jgi:hypothetical protein
MVFRGKFMHYMNHARQCEKLKLSDNEYNKFKNKLYAKKWIVDVRDPVKNPEHVLEYLARYTHRVAIANSRITTLQDGMVTFKINNRKQNRTEQVTITAVEFIRRFLLHSLPRGFVRIRHYGFLANRNRAANLNAIRQLMESSVPPEKQLTSVKEMMLKLTGIDITVCPCCNKGRMQMVVEIPKRRAPPPNLLAWASA